MANYELVVALVLSLSLFLLTSPGDPDILNDFVVPNGAYVDGNFFTYTGMSLEEFPALDRQSVSFAVLEFPAGSVNPPHTHPRGSELLFLIYGSLEVGFVDMTNKLFTQTLQTGDMFIFPKGLVHYHYNANQTTLRAGTVSVPVTVFGTNIDDGILAKSFKTSFTTIQALKAAIYCS
ncbi:hypothetical protein BT93_H3834 [Corymbia citriodora subsp. variegata]|nr:hypothetical protein BT93_H3834 [Corymbia citriodora subsp. variegata]